MKSATFHLIKNLICNHSRPQPQQHAVISVQSNSR
uniref:Uncharacterized protein n=1 Tax=Arundo donax TaxID=35708 RepID=A0A0A8Z6D0_ARUDO